VRLVTRSPRARHTLVGHAGRFTRERALSAPRRNC
jgi:hypothetical protein